MTSSSESPAVLQWTTKAGLKVRRASEVLRDGSLIQESLENSLDYHRGMLIFRGSDLAIGYQDPPLEITVRGSKITVRALNPRGRVLLRFLTPPLVQSLNVINADQDRLDGTVTATREVFAEEDRTRHAGVFAAVRGLIDAMSSPADGLLGLYGAFGYDLIFQLEVLPMCLERDPNNRDLVLHLPDEVIEFDLRHGKAIRHRYDFTAFDSTTDGLPRNTSVTPFVPQIPNSLRDHQPGEYEQVVSCARRLFRTGDLFEAVPGQMFSRGCTQLPSALFRRLRAVNLTSCNLLMNLGDEEYLLGASPETFVEVRSRVIDGVRRLVVASKPISGTIARGADALEDAEQIRTLLASAKEESELTMCTDVDRNDKARVCMPGTIRVTARRSIEMYSTLIHTVDHVEGVLDDGRDALDGFLAHLWAVTVTGAPKLAAVEFIERTERSPRRWYGGAVGSLTFDGAMDTVLTLRTIHVHHGVAMVRAGATLLYDSSPEAEEKETELKARALLQALEEPATAATVSVAACATPPADLRILVVDHRDSFAHTLGDYLRQTGAQVITYRAGGHLRRLVEEDPDLVVLSPGPGRPADFGVADTIAAAQMYDIPVFGVCLGLQGLVEYCGGTLSLLGSPMHGKPSRVLVTDGDSPLFAGLPEEFEVGRYHSLYVASSHVPKELRVTAETHDGVAMAVEHRERPLAAVQFHPESIMTTKGGAGRLIVANAVRSLTSGRRQVPHSWQSARRVV
jgi:anthranilate synthase